MLAMLATRVAYKACVHIAVLVARLTRPGNSRNRWSMSINSRAAAITVAAGLVEC